MNKIRSLLILISIIAMLLLPPNSIMYDKVRVETMAMIVIIFL